MSARSVASRPLVVLVEPLLVALVHVIYEAIRKGERYCLLDGIRGLDVRYRVAPTPRRIQLFIVIHEPSAIWGGNVGSWRRLVLLGTPCGPRTGLARGRRRQYSLQVMFLLRQVDRA